MSVKRLTLLELRKGVAVLLAWTLAFSPTAAMAQQGSTTTNGTVTSPLVKPGFLFEPEFPLNSLKTVPIWNELEQLLDNPYREVLCSSLPASVDPLVPNTPGTTGSLTVPGAPTAVIYPAYCSNGVVRRPSFNVLPLPPLLLHPLNYNPTDGEEMRLLNPGYPGGTWVVPDQLVQCSDVANPKLPAGCNGTLTVNDQKGNPVTTGPLSPDRWVWTYKDVPVTPGSGRVLEAEIDYNAPIAPDLDPTIPPLPPNGACIVTTEAFPPEGATICGGDTGEPIYAGFGVNNPQGYSTPAVPGGTLADPLHANPLLASARLFDPTGRGLIQPRDNGGAGGLLKPSLRIPAVGGSNQQPNFLYNSAANLAARGGELAPSNENDYIRGGATGSTPKENARRKAMVLGKSLFWDMQVGSDAVQSCGSCHAHAGADNRTKNQMNPNHIGGDLTFEVRQPNEDLTASDFPLHKLTNPDIAGDPKCTTPITATANPGLLENPRPATETVCDAGNIVKTTNDVASSMGVHFGRFFDIPPIGSFGLLSTVGGVRSVLPDLRSPVATDNVDPIPGFAGVGGPTGMNQFRRVEPRNTPTVFAAGLNFDNFWDGRARHDFNGGSVFGAADPQSHVFVDNTGTLTATRQIIRFVSMASLATGPALSEFEMSLLGRNWAKIGKKLLQAGVTPLANQLVDPTDSILGPYSNQGGASSTCTALAVDDRSGSWSGTNVPGKPGLCISYPGLIRAAYDPSLSRNTTWHLNGCYTDGRPDIHPNQCVGTGAIPILAANGTVDNSNTADPFDGYKLTPAAGAASATDTNQFTQMEANMSLFFGLSVQIWASILMPDNTPFDRFLDQNPDMFESIGEVGEPGLVGPLPVCTSATQRHCFREVGNFKRDSSFANATTDPTYNANANNCMFLASGEGSTTYVPITPCKGSRAPNSNAHDPLLGMDIFQGSNLSLKNPNFRAARCGECHAGGTLTDNTMPFTFKAQLGDFIGEFLGPGNEALIEPLGRTRVISGFLLESEFNENGQDAIERRIINQSIKPCQATPGALTDGLAFPGGLEPGSGQGFGECGGAASSFFDNGVYNLGVTRCEADQSAVTGVCDDNGRGNVDAFGWPMSLAALLLKNLGGPAQQPGVALATFDPALGNGGGLFEETAQDQQINPGEEDQPLNPLLPAYLAPFASRIPVGDSMPELDEIHGGLNALTDVGITEGFIDVLGPFNPAGILNESYNNGDGPLMGTWPIVNRVGRFGSIKAPQLREVELTGPYFHNGGKLTLRQVVDFYVRGGDFPLTNATHRDFNIINLHREIQSNLSEAEIVALVDFLLELTDERVRFERGPFDHPELILPLDGTAPENTFGRDGFGVTGACTPASQFGPGQRSCLGGMFLDVPAVGAAGNPGGPIPNFLGISNTRLVGADANCGDAATSQYCH